MKEWICAAAGTAGSFLIAAVGGWDLSLQILLAFMAVDFCTGILTAAVFHRSAKSQNGRLESRRCFQGICRKIAMLMLVAAGHAMDLLLGCAILRNAVIIGFCTNEVISITENAGLMGVPLPAAWKNTVSVLSRKQKAQDAEREQSERN
ncbi:holin family protein [uncultured Ruminococcus sp.]|uniref:phage holin family protein n=1 Tax=uncultured Ruminococcus sp. TaxID=165186 RepID=UPI00261190CD|nr:phage holin family protein [uncultured Ruminococcus sp.]